MQSRQGAFRNKVREFITERHRWKVGKGKVVR